MSVTPEALAAGLAIGPASGAAPGRSSGPSEEKDQWLADHLKVSGIPLPPPAGGIPLPPQAGAIPLPPQAGGMPPPRTGSGPNLRPAVGKARGAGDPIAAAAAKRPVRAAPTPEEYTAAAAAVEKKLEERQAARATLKAEPNKATAAAIEKAAGGKELLAAMAAFRAIPPAQKNGIAALGGVKDLLDRCNAWLKAAEAQGSGVSAAVIAQTKATRDAAAGEAAKLESIRQAVTTLATPDPKFDETGEWNKTGGIRIKSTKGFLRNDPDKGKVPILADAGTPERQADSRRQIEKFNAILDAEVCRSDAFAELVAQSMNAGGKSFDMYFGKGTVGFYDDYGNLGVDVDDLDSLPTDPRDLADGRKGGVTRGEIMAHVLEERMYGFQGDDPLEYIDAHQRCLAPGSFQNRHRREMGIPADSILFDNCKHAHTKDGCACFEAMDTQGVKTSVHDIPADLKAGKALNTPGTEPPPLNTTEVEQVFPGTPKQNVDALIATLLLTEKKKIVGQIADKRQNKETLDKAADPFDWNTAGAANLLHMLTIAEENDRGRIEARKAVLKAEIDAYAKRALAGAVLPEALERKKRDADVWRMLGDSDAEKDVAAQRARRPAVVNTGSKADGATNCAMCTLGAILGTSSEEAARLAQAAAGSAKPDAAMQGPGLFFNAAVGVDDSKGWDERKAALEKKMGKAYIDELVMRYKLDPAAADFAYKLVTQAEGDFQFEGLRLMLEKGIEKGNARGAVQRELVQDGVPDDPDAGGKMYPWPELVKRMTGYPDGTQFQVFVKGTLQHWIYADKVKGKVIFEDYQKNESKTVKTPAPVPRTLAEVKSGYRAVWDAFTGAGFVEFAEAQNVKVPKPKGPANADGTEPEQEYRDLNDCSVDEIVAAMTERTSKTLMVQLTKKIKETAPPTAEEHHTLPSSAYVASATDKPHHPQKDAESDAFQEGMFFAIVPKGGPKPADAPHEKKIGAVRAALGGR